MLAVVNFGIVKTTPSSVVSLHCLTQDFFSSAYTQKPFLLNFYDTGSHTKAGGFTGLYS
jgi:hypothetical protein